VIKARAISPLVHAIASLVSAENLARCDRRPNLVRQVGDLDPDPDPVRARDRSPSDREVSVRFGRTPFRSEVDQGHREVALALCEAALVALHRRLQMLFIPVEPSAFFLI
jgi:hypothetical protein